MMEILFPLSAGIIALLFVVILASDVSRRSPGSDRMKELSQAVQLGARTFLRREYSYVAIFVVVIAFLIAIAPLLRPNLGLGWKTSVSFIIGALVSALAGYIGMSIATRANARTTEAARSGGLKAALNVAISGGGVMGFSVVGLSLIGLSILYYVFEANPVIINGYAMGASLLALFARSGGGIYTKGADMAADLVGKVEAGIPEDDPRNPAVIADNVGDNVGDVAGLGSDLLESYIESIIATITIAAVGVTIANPASLKILPLYLAGMGILASIVGVLFVKLTMQRDPQKSLMAGTYVSALLAIGGTYLIIRTMGVEFEEGGRSFSRMGIFFAVLAGIVAGVVVGFISEFFTSSRYRPTRIVAENAQSGPALAITEGMAVGMQSIAIPVIVLAGALIFAYQSAGFYGVAMAAMGMLVTTGMIVSVDSYGPIADNAGGISEMAQLPPEVRKITDGLDAVGNTTAAIGKGFAIGSAAFAALGLLVAFMKSAQIEVADLSDPKVLAGLLVGAMLPFLFSSMLFRAVSKVAFTMIEEVRRQFRSIAGLMEGRAKPDHARCVDISTAGAIHGMLLPGIMIILVPIVIGLSPLGKEGLAGVLMGAVASGVMLGIQFANSGGAMDNAKKYIEEGNFGGKGSDAHKAAVVGDTVGDPLKDTVGPSINILIKLLCVISLVLSPLFL